jgi:hypothetical protein
MKTNATQEGIMQTIGDVARKLHQPIVNYITARGSVARDSLKYEAASMSGRGGTSANALAAVAIHQMEREGRIVLSKSGKSWKLAV